MVKARARRICSSFAIRLDLDLPILAQYGHYLAGVVRGDLGESFRFQQPVTRVVLSHYPATLELAIVALLVCAAIGIPAGLLAAERRGTSTDHAVGRLHAPWPLGAEFRAGPGADSGVFRDVSAGSPFPAAAARHI